MLKILDYTRYRKLILDFYKEKQREDPRFSYRKFAKMAGMENAGFLHNIIRGKRQPTIAYVLKIAKAMELNDEETRYFATLIEFNLAKTAETKKYFRAMLSLLKSARGKRCRR